LGEDAKAVPGVWVWVGLGGFGLGRVWVGFWCWFRVWFLRRWFSGCWRSLVSENMYFWRILRINLVAIREEFRLKLAEFAGDEALRCESNFAGRLDVLDTIELYMMSAGVDDSVRRLAEQLRNELEEIDARWFKRLRDGIVDGVLRGEGLKEVLVGYAGKEGGVAGAENGGGGAGGAESAGGAGSAGEAGSGGYDILDSLINGVLANGDVPEAVLQPEPGMVFYQKTPARIILELERLGRFTAGDVFVDLGSGLGQVVVLIGLLTEARCIGVEYEPAYHSYAEDCCGSLGLEHVRFVNADACTVAYDEGTVFYLYTPFEGRMLEDVLELLREQALKRVIRVFTYGPCSRVVGTKEWLACRKGDFEDDYQLCEFSNTNLDLWQRNLVLSK